MNFATSASVILDLRYEKIGKVAAPGEPEMPTSWNPLTSPCRTWIQRALSLPVNRVPVL